MRLGVMLPAMVIGPAGLVLYGLAGQHTLHWITYFVGVAMVDWSSYWYFTFALAVSFQPAFQPPTLHFPPSQNANKNCHG